MLDVRCWVLDVRGERRARPLDRPSPLAILPRMPRWSRPLLVLLVATLCGALAGCYSLSQPVVEPPHRPPFAFQSLKLPNDCFIESVRFHDAYVAAFPKDKDRWVHLFHWGARNEDDVSVMGHCVALYVRHGRLEFYDANFGCIRLPVGPDHRTDITEFAPPIYARYPKFRPIRPELLTDVWHDKAPALRGDLEPAVSESHRQVLLAAHELAKVRAVRVVRFRYKKDGSELESAAAIFQFQGRMFFYTPEIGTAISVGKYASIDNLTVVQFHLVIMYGRDAKVQLVSAK